MKGIVFTEFLEMVEAGFSVELAETLIDESALPSGGAYTAVGNYHHDEMLTLVTKLSEKTDMPIPDLVYAFGQHLFKTFHSGYPGFFEGIDDAYAFLKLVDNHIHIEVHKLYPDAKLPRFDTEVIDTEDERGLKMEYSSPRPFAALAHGLIQASLDHWGHTAAKVETTDFSKPGENRVLFDIREPV